MPREDDLRELRREVERIKDRIDDIGHIQALQMRADAANKEHILKYFEGRGGDSKARIYLAADGSRSVSEIAREVGLDQGQVTRKCQEMYEHGLLGWHADGTSKCYHKTVIERALRLSRDLEKIVNSS